MPQISTIKTGYYSLLYKMVEQKFLFNDKFTLTDFQPVSCTVFVNFIYINLNYSCTGEWNRHGSFGHFSSNISSNQTKLSLKIIFISVKIKRWVDYLKIWITSERL